MEKKKVRKNKIVPVSLPDIHVRKLNIIRDRTGLSYTGIIQRLIENHDIFKLDDGGKKTEP
jgi:hypothetical protein